MKIEQWPIDRPVPYARNARIISDQAVAKVAASLKEYGWRQPIVVDGDGVIIAGHTRLQAAQRLGMDKVPVHVAKDLSEQQVKAYRLADNRTGQESEWDNDLLRIELEDFDLTTDAVTDLTAFDAGEISALLEPPNFDPAGEDDQGRLDELDDNRECPNCGHKWHE